MKQAKIIIETGKPIKIIENQELDSEIKESSISKAIGITLKQYQKNIQLLINDKYLSQKDLFQQYLQKPCNIYVFICKDGVFVRYDDITDIGPVVRTSVVQKNLSDIAPMFSDSVLHFPNDFSNYIPEKRGPELVLFKNNIDPSKNEYQEILKTNFEIYAKAELPEGYVIPTPPNRPIPLVSLTNEITINIEGELIPTSITPKEVTKEEQFITFGKANLPVGWLAIEIYPTLSDDHWNPDYTMLWAELDILATLCQKNTLKIQQNQFDSRNETRKFYSDLLKEFESLLNGLEEPLHQFLKRYPQLLCPTHEKCWSKVKFGKTISDFVFREVHNDYQLVEIEAPIRELFRNDGQQRQELTHALNQITDWVQYIQENKLKVENELELKGISTNPRTLIVIGRSATLTNENRKKLETLQAQQNKLRIMTYDDVLSNAYHSLGRIFGSLDLQVHNMDLFIREKY